MGKRSAAAADTKRRIAEAALELFRGRDYDLITLAEIAEAAGVSHQTVLNHFDNKAGVVPAAAAVFSEQVRDLETETVPGDITSIVHTTCVRYEALGDMNARWASMESRLPELVGPVRHAAQRGFQSWLEEMFDGVLPTASKPDVRRRVLLGLHAALDVFTWKLFRRDLGLDRAQTEQQMTDLVLGVLGQHRP